MSNNPETYRKTRPERSARKQGLERKEQECLSQTVGYLDVDAEKMSHVFERFHSSNKIHELFENIDKI